LIGLGLVRKVLIGNTLLRMIPPDVFRQPYDFGGNALTVYLLAYGFVIYNDFAGYTAIARGISGFFGIDLSPNFQLPYFASTFTEFWNRWHMSFSFWLRDYIFFPVSRGLARVIPDRRHPIHRIVPPMITMLISGLWHAADWHMLIWGGLHGLYVMARQVPLPGRRPGPPDKQPLGVRIASTLIVFGCVMLAWIPFRMGVITSWLYLTGIIVRFGQGPIPIVPLLLLIPALALDVLEARGGELAALRWPRPARSAALALMILIALVTMFNAATGTTFVYQEF
jgi:D-alanyl-lipoteichoic acid acyltransferase DltB (MBOAT superfamily)